MSIQSILDHKGNKVITMAPDTKVGVAAHRLRLERIGAIVITGEGLRIEGILSERDVVHGLTEHGAAVIDLPVSALMSRNVHTCRPDVGNPRCHAADDPASHPPCAGGRERRPARHLVDRRCGQEPA